MKKQLALVTVLATALSAPAMAGFQNAHTGGAKAHSSENVSSVAQAKRAHDNAPFSMAGQIISCRDDDNCTFKDATGSIPIDVEDGAWRGQTITPKQRVKISGRVDRDDDSGRASLDVYRIQKY